MAAMNYDALIAQAESLIRNVPYVTANLANLSALLYTSLKNINWAGFYLMENGKLVLGPFQGNPACIEIPLGKGVCGTAAKEDKTLVVPDVHLFAGHIACDSASLSEIVVPLHCGGAVVGVLDIDSPILDRFTEEDRKGLEQFAATVERMQYPCYPKCCFQAYQKFLW